MNRIYRLLISLSIGLTLVIGLVLFLQSTPVVAETTPTQEPVVAAAMDYLQSQQLADGGILGFSNTSDPDTTVRSVLAFTLAGQQVSGIISVDGKSMLDYLNAQAISFTHDITGNFFPGRAGMILSAVSLADGEPLAVGVMDLVGELGDSLQATGAYSSTAQQGYSSGQASDLNQAWSILGLSLAGESVPEVAGQYLVQSQAADGSWGFGDPDTTALAVTALLTSDRMSPQDLAIKTAIQYFHDTQLDSGGWRPSWDTDPLNADSTGWILQALYSAGEDPASQDWMIEQTNPIDALMSMQKPDGSMGGTYANPYSTADALIGLAGVPLANVEATQTSSQAGLAVFFGDGRVVTNCVSFSDSSLTGLELLQRSELSIETATNPNQGTAVCKIGDVGSPSADCFGSMPYYWSYWQLGESGWAYAVVGAEQGQVVDGDVNAWSWGEGDAPVLISYQNICEAVPFVMPEATQTSIPPTGTPQPTMAGTAVPTVVQSQPTTTPEAAQTSAGTYIVYGSIIVVLGALIYFVMRSRSK